jgi:hypothetical protein
LTSFASLTTLVVYQYRERRLWLHTNPNYRLHQFGGDISSHMAASDLSATSKQVRYRRYSTWKSLFLACILYGIPVLQLALEKWLDDCVLDHFDIFADLWMWCFDGF